MKGVMPCSFWENTNSNLRLIMIRRISILSSFVLVSSVLSVMVSACNERTEEEKSRSDLEREIRLIADVDSLRLEKRDEFRDRIRPGRVEFLYVPFSARVRLKERTRNWIQYAREGRFHREFSEWAIGKSRDSTGGERLRHFSLLANLSAERWYDRNAGERIELSGVLRYRREADRWVYLGASDGYQYF
jgi:hypothetical protein